MDESEYQNNSWSTENKCWGPRFCLVRCAGSVFIGQAAQGSRNTVHGSIRRRSDFLAWIWEITKFNNMKYFFIIFFLVHFWALFVRNQWASNFSEDLKKNTALLLVRSQERKTIKRGSEVLSKQPTFKTTLLSNRLHYFWKIMLISLDVFGP